MSITSCPQHMQRHSLTPLVNAILLALILLIALGVLALSAGFYSYARVAATLPPAMELRDRANTFKSTAIYDRDGTLIYEIFPDDAGRRTVVPLGNISPNLINATLAVEDPNFYRHPGVDPVGVARAVYYLLRTDDRAPGGSGIAQQLVKLTFLSTDRTFSRKLNEAVLAIEINRQYTKDDILGIYLNHIPYGNLAYGAEAAAQTYFDKPAGALTLAEASLIAGLSQAPGYYDPYRNWDAARARQADVLRLMVEHNFITPTQATSAWMEWEGRSRDQVLAQGPVDFPYAHFVLMVREQLVRTYGADVVSSGGLRVTTTLDRELQEMAERAVETGVTRLAERKAQAHNAALVAIDPLTGEVLALVGSPDYDDAARSGQVNMALVPRQTGSVIKPLTYLATFELADNYWTPATMIEDTRTEFPDGTGRPPYIPKNYDGEFHGLVSLRSALANSYNIPAVKALDHVGVPALVEVAERLGITSLTRADYGLSLTLGGGEVDLLHMTAAFAAFSNLGYRVTPHVISRVESANGALLEDNSQPIRQQVISPQDAYLITSILSDRAARRPAFGNLSRLLQLVDRPAAVKTGTTDDWRDGWTIGYTPDLVTGVWVGNADNTPMNRLSGVQTAAPIWQQFMTEAHMNKPVRSFERPFGVVELDVCSETGLVADDTCQNRRTELFNDAKPPATPTPAPTPVPSS